MSDRRTFLSTVTGSMAGMALGPVVPRAQGAAITVSAESTVFWQNPDGSANLVRFLATGTDAPAGRLRVYDRSRRLLGTAGMLRAGDGLRGELWLRLDEPTAVLSELEAPGRRSPLRTAHRLTPSVKWTIVWLTVADPGELVRHLEGVPPINRLIRTAIWRDAGVIANPIPPAARLHEMDHLPFLRAAETPGPSQHELGLPTAAIALVGPLGDYPATTPLALRGAGIRHVVRSEGPSQPAWWSAPDGSRILAVPLVVGADPVALGFPRGGAEMARRVEAFLEAGESGSHDPTRVIVQTGVTDELPRMVGAVREWTRSYAFPRIAIGGAPDLDRILAAPPAAATTMPVPDAPELPRPSASTVQRVTAERAHAMDRRVEALLAPIAALLDAGSVTTDPARRIAEAIDTRVPGWLVVNPSPFRRTDAVRLPDGRLQLITDVPALGYAFVLDEGVAPEPGVSDAPTPASIAGARLVATLDPTSGNVRSLRDRDTGREWLRGTGGNDASARLEAWERRVAPGVATQLVAQRYSAYHGEFQTVVTAYDHLPWIDVENRADGGDPERMDYSYEFAVPDPTVRWEIPAGHREGRPPRRYVPYVRWIALDSPDGSVLIGGPQTPYCGIGLDGRLEFPAAAGTARYRILVSSTAPPPVECARFGWAVEPLRAVPVAGTAGGSAQRFGHAVVLDQPDAALIGLKGASDGHGLIAYVQNLTPDTRFASLGYGLLEWTDARLVDLRGRELGGRIRPVPDGAAFDVPPWGVVAVRLTGVRLREA